MDFLEEMQELERAQSRSSSVGGRPVKNRTGRMRKIECGSCGLKLHSTSGAKLGAVGMPTCACGGVFYAPELRDQLVIDEDAATLELLKMDRSARRDALSRIGWTRDQITGWNEHFDRMNDGKPRGGAGTQRCQWPYGNCRVYVQGQYCHAHKDDRWGRS